MLADVYSKNENDRNSKILTLQNHLKSEVDRDIRII